MTTSITDARFTSLHFTAGHLLSLDIDEPAETGWSVMPGYDQTIPIPFDLEPPRTDADETLPNLLHPSYPFGRPVTLGARGTRGGGRWVGPGNLLGTVGSEFVGPGSGVGGSSFNARKTGEEVWNELGLGHLVQSEHRKEIPPGMAGAKRPPSPLSPSLQPHRLPPPRSQHLRNLYSRQRNYDPPAPTDAFDAPVPNETYAEAGEDLSGLALNSIGGSGVRQRDDNGVEEEEDEDEEEEEEEDDDEGAEEEQEEEEQDVDSDIDE